MPLTPDTQGEYRRIIQEAARLAGQIQMDGLGTVLEKRTKHSGIDIVTNIDHACDAIIQSTIRQAFPADQILTEETFEEGQIIDLSNTWVVDPLDGTTNYTHGFPYFAVSIAYFQHNFPKLGVVFYPSMNELFYAAQGEGAWRNGRPVTVTHAMEWHESLIATGFPYDVTRGENAEYLDYFTRMLCHAQGLRRPGAAALDLSYLACGRIDGFWEFKLSPWDVAAGALLIQEAGGVVSDFEGRALDYAQRRINIMAAATPGLHQAMVTLFGKSRTELGL